jgi:hypothetical protein
MVQRVLTLWTPQLVQLAAPPATAGFSSSARTTTMKIRMTGRGPLGSGTRTIDPADQRWLHFKAGRVEDVSDALAAQLLADHPMDFEPATVPKPPPVTTDTKKRARPPKNRAVFGRRNK